MEPNPSQHSSLVSAWQALTKDNPVGDASEWPSRVLDTLSKALEATILGTLSIDTTRHYVITRNQEITRIGWTPPADWDTPFLPSWGGEHRDILLIGRGTQQATAMAVQSVAWVTQHWNDLAWFLRLSSTQSSHVPKPAWSRTQLARQTVLTQGPMPRHMIESSLEKLLAFLEHQRPTLFAAVMLYRQGRLEIAAAPSLPLDFQRVVDGMQIGPRSGSCGTAGYYKRPIYTEDLTRDSRWESVQWIGQVYGLRSCWSIPLLGASGILLGTSYSPEPHYPSPQDLEWMYLVRDWVVEALKQESPNPSSLDDPKESLATILQHDRVGQCIRVVDPGFLTPSQAESLVGTQVRDLVHMREKPRVMGAIKELHTTGVGRAVFRIRYDLEDRQAKYHWVHTRIVPETSCHETFLSTTHKLTRYEVRELLISGELMVDPVTELPILGFWATDSLGFSHQARQVMLVMVEIDQFDLYAMAVGHNEAAKTLKTLVMDIRSHLPARAIMAQMSDCRLGILISDPDPGLIPGLFQDANDAIRHRDQAWQPTISAGIIHVEYQEDKMDQFLHQAGVALKEAQAAGGAQYRYYEPMMDALRLQSATLEHDLRNAFIHGDLSLVYQPIVSSKTWCIEGFEALARWEHRTRGPISPTEFIPIAEKSGLIKEIGASILRQALHDVGEWQRVTNNPVLYVHVNVSLRQMEDPTFPEMVLSALSQTGFSAPQLKLEITESMLVKDLARALDTMHQLHRLGVSWSLDDFGTGYSSLAALRTLPIQVLKIDREFVSNIHDRPTRAIVKTLIQLAKALKLSIVAEGVQTDTEWAHLARLGCHLIQGFLVSRPVDAGSALALLHQGIRPGVLSR